MLKLHILKKARQKPDKVKMVLDKVKSDGLVSTYEAVQAKLKELIPLGYSNVGIVEEVGKDVHDFKPGDRVISNGYHADVVNVSKKFMRKNT